MILAEPSKVKDGSPLKIYQLYYCSYIIGIVNFTNLTAIQSHDFYSTIMIMHKTSVDGQFKRGRSQKS